MNYTKEQLEDYTIHDLRLIGRSIGVRAPSAMVKKDLVQAILSVQDGCVKPHLTSRGRPRKTTLEIEQKIFKPNSKFEQKVDVLLAQIKKTIMELVKTE